MTKKELVEYLNNFEDDAEVLVLENGKHYEDNYSIEDVYQVTTRSGAKEINIICQGGSGLLNYVECVLCGERMYYETATHEQDKCYEIEQGECLCGSDYCISTYVKKKFFKDLKGDY